MDFTPEQKTAITKREKSLLVSAGAGSGKTRVLVERLVARVTDPDAPQDVDRFLIITYTRAAAAELRERISARLAELSAAAPGDRHLRRQTALVNRARIGTIHSFCASLLREHAHLLGIPQDFRVADETRAAPLRRSVLTRVLEDAYERIGEDADFRALADTVGAGRDDSRLEEVLLSLWQRMTSHPDPDAWAAECLENVECAGVTDAGETVWGAWLLSRAKTLAASWRRRLDAAALDFSADPSLARAYGESFAAAADLLEAFEAAAAEGWNAAREALPTAFPRLKGPRQPYDACAAEQAKAVWNGCKDAMKQLGKRLVAPSAESLGDLRATAPAARALLRLTADFSAAYAREKRRASLLDYSDLEHRSLALLLDENGAPSEAAREVSRRFVEVMVDEYQDVNAVQDAIFGAVSREGKNLFLVGDVKQSIYRFRLADPTIFLGRYAAWADGKDGERVLLRMNFRSRPEIIEAVNFCFGNLMSRALGELDYDGDAALVPDPDRVWPDAEPPLVRMTVADADADDEEDERTSAQAEAAVVAAQLRALYDAGTPVQGESGPRPLRWSDVCLLLRSPGSHGAEFRAALEEARIPVQSEQGADLFSFDEVTVTLHLLALADNPRQDLPLVSVLRSALFGLTPDELAAIRSEDGDAPLYDALCLRAEKDEKARAFLELLGELRRDAQDLPLGDFLWRVYARTGALAVAAALPGGAARRENLLRLTALAGRFEESGRRGLGPFLRWIDDLRESGEAPVEPPAGGDAVRLMSIHKSKGLEFPVVFLAGLGHRFNRRDISDTLPVDASLGLGLRRTDLARGVEYPTIARTAVQGALIGQLLSEELRVLYVAMTRAKERLYLSCAFKNPEKKLDRLGLGLVSPLDPSVLETAACPADWLLRAAMLPGSPIPIEIVKPPAAPCHSEERSDEESPREILRLASLAQDDAGETAADAAIDLSPVLDWRYPFSMAQSLPAKLTATELKSRAPEAVEDAEAAALLPKAPVSFRAPDFGGAQAGPLTGAARGTATHRFLQYAELAAATEPGGTEAEKARLVSCGRLTPEEAGAVDAGAVEWFLSTDAGGLVVSGAELRRELRFSLLVDAGDFYPGAEGDEILLQGIVDCCVLEPDGVTVLDYKTDRVSGEALDARAEHYAPQLRAYARALARMTGLKVKRCALVFLFSREMRDVAF